MKNKFEISGLNLILILLFLTVSCKSYRNVEKLQPKINGSQEEYFVAESEFEKIKTGEKILVELVSGKKYYMKYGSISENVLNGKVWKVDATSWKYHPFDMAIPFEEIKKVYVRRTDYLLTSVVSVGSSFIIIIITYVIAVSNDGFGW